MRLSTRIATLVKFITRSLVTTAVVRPLVTVGLVLGRSARGRSGGGARGEHGRGHRRGRRDRGDGRGIDSQATYPLQQLLSKLFSRFYVERAELLASALHDLVLGEALVEVKRLAETPNGEAFTTVRKMIEELSAEPERIKVNAGV